MINNISWAAYWYTLAVILSIYYVAVALFYYRTELVQLFQGRRAEVAAQDIDNGERIVQSVIDELNAFFEEAKKTKWVKNELLFALQKLLIKYSSIRDSIYKESINNLIIVQSQNICSVHFNDEEINHVWMS